MWEYPKDICKKIFADMLEAVDDGQSEFRIKIQRTTRYLTFFDYLYYMNSLGSMLRERDR